MYSPSQEQHGLALPSRRANVTVTRRASLHSDDEGGDSVGPLSRDSLEGTRRYYGISTSPTPDNPRQRTISNSPRPLSNTASDVSYQGLRSPPRSQQAPLPVPRGFLAPQKPAAARRLEQRERTTTVSTTGRVSLDLRRPESEHVVASPGSDYSQSFPTPPNRTSGSGALSPTSPVGLGITNAAGPSQRTSASASSPPGTPHRSRVPPQPIQTPTRPGESFNSHEPNWEDRDAFGHEKQPSGNMSTIRSSAPLTGRKKSFKRVDPKPTGFLPTRTRKYKVLENKNVTFFLGGRLMTGGDSPLNFLISLTVLFGLCGCWFGTTGVWMWKNGHKYGMVKGGGIIVVAVFIYLFGLVVSSLIAASLREPGILPRGLDPDPPYTPVDVYWEATPREILVGKDGKDRIEVKYCETCKSYRPPRCSHCRICGNCVEGIDHHCGYLHACIGRRNYFSFIVFLVSITVGAIYIVVFSAIHFKMVCHGNGADEPGMTFRQALGKNAGAGVSFALGVCVLPPIVFLLYYHIRLLLFNLTTIEQIRASASSNLFRATARPYNPFAANSTARNILNASIGRPQYPSWLDASGYAIEDNRRVNPALTTPEKYLELV